MAKAILIVEDETVLRESLAELMSEEGFQVFQAGDGQEAYEFVLKQPVDLVLSDVRMPRMDGLALLGQLQRLTAETPVIMLTAYGTVQSAVAAMQAGASDYLLKPVQFDELRLKIQRVLEYGEAFRTRRVMTEQMAAGSVFHNLVGNSQSLVRLFEMVRTLSAVKSNVLILGESGTGKELFARAVHFNGITREKPFVAVNCGAIPATLVESELFGYRRGAFTGANQDKIGYFEAANGGTLFLDEISALPLSMQSSMLRALEERVIVPLGDTRGRRIELRVISASNRDLEEMVAAGEFREDLLYRLNVVKLQLPPLRHHKEDIPLLAYHFLDRYAKEMNKRISGISSGAMRVLLSLPWQGNVRELENAIERAVIFAPDGGQISVQHLPSATDDMSDEVGETLKDAVRQFERQHIISSLRRHNYDKTETARYLGIGVSSLYRKMDELNIAKNLGESGNGGNGGNGDNGDKQPANHCVEAPATPSA